MPCAPIQRTISLHGEDQDKDANVARLNALLGDSGGRVKRTGNTVAFEAHPPTQGGREHWGYKLVNRIVAHANDVKIGIHPEKGVADPVMTPYNIPNASTPGTGSNAFVHMPRVAPASPVTVWDKDKQQYLAQNVPEHIQLGHELIHADHTQRGTLTPYAEMGDNRVAGNLAGFGAVDTKMREHREELVTIGLAPGAEGDDITENRLRQSFGLLPRVAHAQVEEHLYKEHAVNAKAALDERAQLETEARVQEANAQQHHAASVESQKKVDAAAQRHAQHSSSAAENLRFAQGLRGGGIVEHNGMRIDWDSLADAHQRNADAAAAEAERAADEMRAHTAAKARSEQLRDHHVGEHRKIQSKHAAAGEQYKVHAGKHAQLKALLKL